MSRARASSGGQLALPIEGVAANAAPLDKPANAAPLDKPAWTPASDDDTSLAAAAHMAKTGKAKSARRRILVALAAQPRTDLEIEQELGIKGSTVRPRRGELLADGLIEATGETRKAPGSRMPAKLYRATQAGREALRKAKR